MSLHALSVIAFWCAAAPAALFCWNLSFFRRPPQRGGMAALPKISVLIPARDEEGNIGAAVESVLASLGVDIEVIVLDDASTDGTALFVHSIAARDRRVRCVSGSPLAAGWAGKAHAAHRLSELAAQDVFCFLDADVRVTPDALARMHAFLEESSSALVSGFPAEITVTSLEWLLLPLIQFLLLSYLPLVGLRHSNLAAFGAGCGQFLMMTRSGYERTGGYASVPATMHDGIALAKLFRRDGLHSDVADLTGLATCRMYQSGAEVWQGLMKNATEGIAAPARIVPFTLLLLCGQVLPWVLLVVAMLSGDARDARLMLAACGLSLLLRAVALWRFRQRAIGAVMHPVGILVFLALQWIALLRKVRKTPAIWKGRAFKVG